MAALSQVQASVARAAAPNVAQRQRASARAAALPSRSSEFASAEFSAPAFRNRAVARSGAASAGRAASLRVFASNEERAVVLAAAPPKPAWKGAALKVRQPATSSAVISLRFSLTESSAAHTAARVERPGWCVYLAASAACRRYSEGMAPACPLHRYHRGDHHQRAPPVPVGPYNHFKRSVPARATAPARPSPSVRRSLRAVVTEPDPYGAGWSLRRAAFWNGTTRGGPISPRDATEQCQAYLG